MTASVTYFVGIPLLCRAELGATFVHSSLAFVFYFVDCATPATCQNGFQLFPLHVMSQNWLCTGFGKQTLKGWQKLA